jgi:hypothetical protein
MRHEVAIVLIICGTLLALAPPASDYYNQREALQVLVDRPNLDDLHITFPQMSSEYRFGCWALGAAVIGVGIYGGWRRRQPPRANVPGSWTE